MGADGVNGNLTIGIAVKHIAPTPYQQAALARILFEFAITPADADRSYLYTGPIGAGSDVDIDLQTITDAYGSAITATELKAIYVLADEDNGSTIVVEPGVANPWVSWLKAGSELVLPAGGAVCGVSPDTAYVVGAANKVLKITNDDGAAIATYTILVVTAD
jgi:hypothetical protein